MWFPHIFDILILESVQKYFTKLLLGMESLTYDERLFALKHACTCIYESIYVYAFEHSQVCISALAIYKGTIISTRNCNV